MNNCIPTTTANDQAQEVSQNQVTENLKSESAMPKRQPATDIIAFDDRYELRVALPGVALEQIKLTSEQRTLRIETSASENESFSYQRSFKLSDDVDSEAISAQLKHGILSLNIPKRQEVTAKKIAINAD